MIGIALVLHVASSFDCLSVEVSKEF
jgi:hypothetical protein